MDCERVHFLLSMSCEAAVHAVEIKLVEGGFRVMSREATRLPSLFGGRHTARCRYELTVIDIHATKVAETLTSSGDRLPRIVIESGRGAYSEVFLAPTRMGDGKLQGTTLISLPNETAIRIARVLLDVGRLAVSNITQESDKNFDDRIIH